MYTDTARPNHLVQEVVDNSVDEALAGHARRIEVVLEKGAPSPCATMAGACPSMCTRSTASPGSS